MSSEGRDPAADLREIAFRLERANEASYRVRAFRSAAAAIGKLSAEELADKVADGTLTKLSGVGEVTARNLAPRSRREYAEVGRADAGRSAAGSARSDAEQSRNEEAVTAYSDV